MNPLLQAAIGSILRALLAGLAGWFVQRGIWTQDAANEYLTAGVLFIVTILWAVWTRYKDRLKFLTALDAPAGTAEKFIIEKIKLSFGAKILVLLLAVGLSVHCGGKLKPTLVKFDSGALTAVQTIAVVEKELASVGQLTPAQSLEIRLQLRPVIDLGEKASIALLSWEAGQMTPPEMLTLSTAVANLLASVTALLPDGSAKSKVVTAIAWAQQAWAVAIALMNTGKVPPPDLMPALVGGLL